MVGEHLNFLIGIEPQVAVLVCFGGQSDALGGVQHV